MSAHARTTDPIGSHLTVASIAKDGSLKEAVLSACRGSYHDLDRPVTDDDLLDWLEMYRSTKRWQRNVISRTRGLLEQDGLIVRLGLVQGRTGRPTVAYAPASVTLPIGAPREF